MRVQNKFLISRCIFELVFWYQRNDTSRITQMFALRLYPSVVKIPYLAHVCKKKYKMYAVIRK